MAGMMIYRIDMDDFADVCGKGAFPLSIYLQRNLAQGGPTATRYQTPVGIDDGNNSAYVANKSVLLYAVSYMKLLL